MWKKDPKTEKPSVSLTMLILAVLSALVAGWLQAFGKIQDASLLSEFLYISVSLYFFRRVSFRTKSFKFDQQVINKDKNV